MIIHRTLNYPSSDKVGPTCNDKYRSVFFTPLMLITCIFLLSGPPSPSCNERLLVLSFRVEVFPDDPAPPLVETARLFNRALAVIGPHGAGESNLLFSEPGTLVVEAVCDEYMKKPRLCFRYV